MSYTILLIEDDPDMRENITSILSLAHYNILVAENGRKGVELAQNHHPDLIICDIVMPQLDGYGVLHILNRDAETANIPFVYLTGKADKNEVRTGMSLGADDYIAKPFDGHDLLKVVEVRLKKSELLRGHSKANGDGNGFQKSSGLKEIRQLYENRPSRTFKRKDFIFMEGQIPSDLYCITSGKVKTHKVNYDGKELITGIHRSGSFIGYIPILKNIPHHENAEVLEDAEVAVIPKQDFLSLLYTNREVMNKFIEMIANNLIEAEGRLLDIAYQSLRQRLARVLLSNQPNGNGGVITISRKDISNMIGTATESLNRTLADFKEEGLIEIGGEGIRILNKMKLEHLMH